MANILLDEENAAVFGDRVRPRLGQVGDLNEQIVDVVLYECDFFIQILLVVAGVVVVGCDDRGV
jgi:hypothetical protein